MELRSEKPRGVRRWKANQSVFYRQKKDFIRGGVEEEMVRKPLKCPAFLSICPRHFSFISSSLLHHTCLEIAAVFLHCPN